MKRLLITGLGGAGLSLVIAAAVLWTATPAAMPEAETPVAEQATLLAATRSAVPTIEPTATGRPNVGPKNSGRDPYEKGKALFVAKGCVTCHQHEKAGVSDSMSYRVGPNLTHIESVPYDSLPNDADFLRKWLKDPAAMKPSAQMPNLGLSDEDIEDLLAFLLADERTPM